MIHVETFAEEALERAAAALERYRSSLPIVAGGYSRTLLTKTPDYEVVAMLWAPGCLSPIHDHAGSRCWVQVLEGSIDVVNFQRMDDGKGFARLQQTGTMRLAPGARDSRLNWRELHQVGNGGSVNACTVQVYAPQLREHHIVDRATGEVRTVPGVYDAVFDL
jgi:predicted metal-dependent enzyme (double-stranded beta helix superfamily)